MHVADSLFTHGQAQPGKVAIVAGGQRLTYGDFAAAAASLAATLKLAGVGRGERVLVFMDNRAEAAVAIYGALTAGAVFSPINPSTKADKLAYVLDNCEPAAVLTEPRLYPVVAEAMAASGRTPLVWSTADRAGHHPDGARSFEDAVAAIAATRPDPDMSGDLAMLVYTSGSTGRPKGVMMTHGNIAAAAASITTYLENTPDDIILSVLPLAFDYGLYQLLMSVRLGATLVLEKSFAFPQAIFDKVRAERVTGLPLVPTMAALMLRMPSLEPNFLPSVRYLTNTAAALPVEHIAALRRLFPEARLYSMYGLTECKRCTYLPPDELDRRPGSVGIAIPGTEAFVLDDDGKRLPPGAVGQLHIRGPHVMQGYWRSPEATAERLKPDPETGGHMLATGDLFRTDEDGFLYFVGRKDDILKTRGEKVAPKEVEAVLHAHADVVEAVVFGVPDPVLGQAIAALVVRRNDGVSERHLIGHCARHLEDFMVPKYIEFRGSLPKTDTGKVSRQLAAQLLGK